MNLTVSRILHAGYIFEYDQTQIFFDPIFERPFSQNCYPFPDMYFEIEQIRNIKPSAVFISHFHDDHCSLESLNLLNKSTPIYIYCIHDEIISLIKQLGFANVHSLALNAEVEIGAFRIKTHKALDQDVDSVFHIQVAEFNVLNVVDSWIDGDTINRLVRACSWDLILWPFQTMREIEVLAPSRIQKLPIELPQEWLAQLQLLSPRYIVPSSCQFIHENWSWYNYALFPISYKYFEQIMNSILPNVQIIKLNPGCSIQLGLNDLKISKPIEWIKPIGDQSLDYQYQPDIVPTKTCNIAKNFQILSEQNKNRVLDYCKLELTEKYTSLELTEEAYFHQPRVWKLSIFDHLGEAIVFNYRIHNDKIELTETTNENLGWSTEIPLSKFYAALELGEALTSLYIRINDLIFSNKVESEILDVDIMEDPLIRCLFTGAVGSYQTAQLKKISNLVITN